MAREDNVTKKVNELCDEARLAAAGHLAGIIRVFAAKAIEERNPSVQHAKFLLEMLLLEVKAEQKMKASEDPGDPGAEPQGLSLTQYLINQLDSMTLKQPGSPGHNGHTVE